MRKKAGFKEERPAKPANPQTNIASSELESSKQKGKTLMGSIDIGIEDILESDDRFAQWIWDAKDLRAGISGIKGYDIGVGKYLKIPLQLKVIDATIKALEERRTTYWDYPGDLPLRISEKLKKENGIEADPMSEILVVGGIGPGIQLVVMAFLNPGDEVLLIDPDFVTNRGYVKSRSADIVWVPLKERKGVIDETRWYFDPDVLESRISNKTKMFIFCNPNNPTGYVYSDSDLKAIAELANKYDLLVFSNECYERLDFSERFAKTLQFRSLGALPDMKDRIITVQGVTKNYHMSGFRVGWLVANPKILEVLKFVHGWGAGCHAPSFSQWGALAALTLPFREDYTHEVLKNYKLNLDILCDALKEVPLIECPRSMGSQFTFADVSAFGISDIELAQYLYEREVITVYGSPWGPTKGPGHLRFSLTNPVDYERECVEKLVEALTDYVKNNY